MVLLEDLAQNQAGVDADERIAEWPWAHRTADRNFGV
jgi:hypothetical protein